MCAVFMRNISVFRGYNEVQIKFDPSEPIANTGFLSWTNDYPSWTFLQLKTRLL